MRSEPPELLGGKVVRSELTRLLVGLLRPAVAALFPPRLNHWPDAGSSGAAAAEDREPGVASLGDGPATVRQPGHAGRSVEPGGEQPATADRPERASTGGRSSADAGEQAQLALAALAWGAAVVHHR
jgi:hypothetical protein